MGRGGNKSVIPEARDALDRFKMEAANEVGVTLKQGYNGNLTSREAGSVGGHMVNNMCPVRILKYERADRRADGHSRMFTYEVRVVA